VRPAPDHVHVAVWCGAANAQLVHAGIRARLGGRPRGALRELPAHLLCLLQRRLLVLEVLLQQRDDVLLVHASAFVISPS
jgi:hypothetical protein